MLGACYLLKELMDTKLLWNNVLEELKLAVTPTIFQTVFQGTSLVSIENSVAKLGCHSSYIQSFIESRYYSLVKDILDRLTKGNNSIIFSIIPKTTNKTINNGPLFQQLNTLDTPTITKTHNLRAEFTFENLAVSSTNQLPYAAAQAVAKSLGAAYNPLFLWGGVGVGKTHIMQAIAHEALKNNPDLKYIFCPGEQFTNEIVLAIRNKSTDEFKKKYRSVKLLMLDDVQFIAGKITVQEEFFHTFNAIQSAGGQVVLTSDRPPQEIEKLEERLKSRFQAGLIADVPKPDFELRTAITLIKAKQKRFDLKMELAQLIGANIDSIREIEGFLTLLVTEANTRNVEINDELVNRLLGKNNHSGTARIIKPKEVIQTVADYYNLKISQLKSPIRLKSIVVPRQVLMYLLRIELKLPLMEVGEILGGRDHTTIMHGVEKITNLVKDDEDLRVDISGIKQKLML